MDASSAMDTSDPVKVRASSEALTQPSLTSPAFRSLSFWDQGLSSLAFHKKGLGATEGTAAGTEVEAAAAAEATLPPCSGSLPFA